MTENRVRENVIFVGGYALVSYRLEYPFFDNCAVACEYCERITLAFEKYIEKRFAMADKSDSAGKKTKAREKGKQSKKHAGREKKNGTDGKRNEKAEGRRSRCRRRCVCISQSWRQTLCNNIISVVFRVTVGKSTKVFAESFDCEKSIIVKLHDLTAQHIPQKFRDGLYINNNKVYYIDTYGGNSKNIYELREEFRK